MRASIIEDVAVCGEPSAIRNLFEEDFDFLEERAQVT
jgi:hypothetical protein